MTLEEEEASIAKFMASLSPFRGIPHLPGRKVHGCICPPTAEQTCKADFCPRQPMPEIK